MLELLQSRRVVFVSGKGGVGKTAVAAAVAWGLAQRGRRVLLVSTDPAHSLGHLWQQQISDQPTPVVAGLDAIEIDPATTVREHLAAVRATLTRIMPEQLSGQITRHLDLARHAPGMHEAALSERVAALVAETQNDYHTVVFDTAPSGHTALLLALPRSLSAWSDLLTRTTERSDRFAQAAGRLGAPDQPSRAADNAQIRAALAQRRARFDILRRVLTDPACSAFVLVLAAERLAVAETLQFHHQLSEVGIDVAALVVNKRSPEQAGELLSARRQVEETYLAQVRRELPDIPLTEVPLLGEDLVGEPGVRAFAHALGVGLR